MAYKLYYSPGACSMAIHVVLNEIGQPVELKRATIGDPNNIDKELLAVNPMGQVPVLQIDGQTMLQGAAMVTYLCDTHKSSLIPAEGFARAQALQWLLFANSTLHTSYSRTAFIARGGGAQDLIEKSQAKTQELWDFVEKHLASSGKPYLCGDAVTAGDILLAVIANWSFAGAYNFGPKTKALLKAVSARPAYQKALQAEQVEYKAAA
jgi:glutathione S-transferase